MSVPNKRFNVGDIVKHTGEHLRSIGWYTDVPKNGIVRSTNKDGWPRVQWCDEDNEIGNADSSGLHNAGEEPWVMPLVLPTTTERKETAMDLITTTRDANGNEAMTDRTWLTGGVSRWVEANRRTCRVTATPEYQYLQFQSRVLANGSVHPGSGHVERKAGGRPNAARSIGTPHCYVL